MRPNTYPICPPKKSCAKRLNIRNNSFWNNTIKDRLYGYPVADIAARSGMGTRNNMYFIYEREFNLSPTERRNAIRQKGDLGRFAIR